MNACAALVHVAAWHVAPRRSAVPSLPWVVKLSAATVLPFLSRL